MNNDDFFKKINNNIGIEAFEEFKETSTMNVLNSLDKLDVDLNLMARVIRHLIDNVDELKDKGRESSNRLAIENMILKFIISKIEPVITEQLENITYVITDAVIDIMEGEK